MPTRDVNLRARVSDPDGGMMDAGFRVLRGTADNYTWDGNETSVGNVPSGTFAKVNVKPHVPADGIYTWHLWSGDYSGISSWSGNCEFEVDTTVPNTPAVTSSDYPYDTSAGGRGRTGAFKITSNGSTDVAYYEYSFTDQQNDDPKTRIYTLRSFPVTVYWTPTVSGPMTMFVRAVDRAGNKSPIHKHYIKVIDTDLTPSAHWKLDGDLADDTGGGKTLTANDTPNLNAEGHNGKGITLDGVNDWLHRPAVLDTTKSFSLSAWVKLDRDNGSSTVVGQDGTTASGVQLHYADESDRWAFSALDSVGRQVQVQSAAAPQVGVWTHLTSTYDLATKRIRLYVNGEQQGEGVVAVGAAAGDFAIGRGRVNGVPAQFLSGTVDDVRTYDQWLTSSDVATLANQSVLRARYKLDEGVGTQTADSVTGKKATLDGPVFWNKDRYTALKFDGSLGSGVVTAPRPAIRTDRSYAVTAWVRHDGFDETPRTAVSIDDPKFSPFLLQYRHEKKQWSFLVTCSPDHACGETALSNGDAKQGEWTHLTGVYDAAAKQIRLYVNGVLSSTVTGVTGWNNEGDLLIGRARWESQHADYWKGLVDDVRLYSGVPTDLEIGQLAGNHS